MACRKSKLKKAAKGIKKVKAYNAGAKQILVPEVTTDVGSTTAQGAMAGASAGASIGSAFGPWGTVIGGAAGGIAGGAQGYGSGKKAVAREESARADALRKNETYKDLGIGDTQIDQQTTRIDQFAKGTKAIEIEGKVSPEIHTDSKFNIKNLGTKSHAEGGNKVMAEDGDVVFDTQNNPDKAKSILNDIRKVKLNGDKGAKKRLEKERDNLPADVKNPQGNDGDPTNVPGTNKFSTQSFNTGNLSPNEQDITGEIQGTDEVSIDKFANGGEVVLDSGQYGEDKTKGYLSSQFDTLPGVAKNEPYDPLASSFGFMNQGETTRPMNKATRTGTEGIGVDGISYKNTSRVNPINKATNVGQGTSPLGRVNDISDSSLNQSGIVNPTEPTLKEKLANRERGDGSGLNKVGQAALTAGQFASPLHKYLKSQEAVSAPKEVPLELERYKYEDTSDVDRENVLKSERAVQRGIDKSGLSRGQALGRLSQTSAKAAEQRGQINRGEQLKQQQIAQQNTQMSNMERENSQKQQLNIQDATRRGEAQKEAFLGEAMSDVGKLAQVGSQKLYMKNKDKKADEMDQKTLQYLLSNNYRINPDTQKLEFINTKTTK